MKKFLLCFVVFYQMLFAKEIIALSIPMQGEFVKEIAGEEYEILSLVKVGTNPHDFEPKFSDVKKVNEAIAYFSLGIEFEDAWLKRFASQNPKMKIFASDKGIEKINFGSDEHHDHHDAHDHNGHEEHSHHHENGDTHIWLSTSNAKIIATNIYEGLKELNPKGNYEENYQKLLTKIDATHKEIKEILKNVKEHQKFVVFHPMLGYFARDYHLEEVSIEIEGKSPKIKDMMRVVDLIKKEKLQVIFAQPEFSLEAAQFIAKESGAKLDYFSPLQTPWSENLINFAKNLKKAI